MMRQARTWLLLGLGLACSVVQAERHPVLQQIQVPHNYYFREMYLPQLTTGPSSVAWSPDGQWLVYAMAGSLWKQRPDSEMAVQLTDGPGYDHQPDWSPDGRHIVFSRYDGKAIELMRLDLGDGSLQALTDNGAVNVEPRYSPDGTRLAFVTTAGDGRFRAVVASLGEALGALDYLLPARQSATARYYYSAWDHQISPSWSPDGRELILVANPETPHGSGDLYRIALDGPRELRLVRREETTWQARPDWSPDGKRVVYASYLGRQWHQLWVTPSDGAGHPFPLSYGDYDVTAARWSPNADRIAYVSNQHGTQSLWVQETIGGERRQVVTEKRQYLNPVGTLDLAITGGNQDPVPARVSVIGPDGRAYAPADAWIHSDDGLDPDLARFERQYFHSPGRSRLQVPAGALSVTVWRGPAYEVERREVSVEANSLASLALSLRPLSLPESWSNMLSADVHVHMNYGGRYRNTPQRMAAQARAEDLDIVFNLIVNKEQRIPDIAYFSGRPDAVSGADFLLAHSQEFHTSYWGHLGLIGLRDHYLLPDYVAYPQTGAASLYPTNTAVADLARKQGALVGYVHPFDALPDPQTDARLTNALPVDVALGRVDYYETVGFSDHRATAEVWYRLLNCGFRLPAAGGTDAMANYASLRGPVGQNRTYVEVPQPATDPAARQAQWLDGLRAGRSVASNGPLVYLQVQGRPPGEEIALTAPGTVHYQGWLRSNVPVDHLELVMNGQVVRRVELGAPGTTADFQGELDMVHSGWLLVRAWSERARPEVLDLYPYATTSPAFVTIAGKAITSARDADYFLSWIERLREAATAHPDYNSEAEKHATLETIDQATRIFQAQQKDRPAQH